MTPARSGPASMRRSHPGLARRDDQFGDGHGSEGALGLVATPARHGCFGAGWTPSIKVRRLSHTSHFGTTPYSNVGGRPGGGNPSRTVRMSLAGAHRLYTARGTPYSLLYAPPYSDLG